MSGTTMPPMGIGMTPSAAGMNPSMAQAAQRLSSMPTEQLQEMAARSGGSPMGSMAQRLLQQRHMMPNAAPQQPQQSSGISAPSATGGNSASPATPIQQTPQATSAGIGLPPTTNAMKRGGGIARTHLASGGISPSQEDPWWTRREASDSGLIHAYSPGRTDTINMEPLAGSYVLPADVVAGLGQDNTLAGAAALDRMFGTAPYGMQQPRGSHGRGPPAPPRQPVMHDARGGPQHGAAGSRVPVIVAGGEYVLSPEQVARIGGGDIDRGHDILDRFVLERRKRDNAKRSKLPPPKKD